MMRFPWKPLRIGFDVDRQIDEAFRELIHSQWGLAGPVEAWQPEIDLFETDDEYLVEADVPGLSAEQLRVEVEEHSVTISGSRQSTGIEHSAHGLKLERRHGEFSRRFYLKEAVDPGQVEHVCAEGLHRIRLKKRAAG